MNKAVRFLIVTALLAALPAVHAAEPELKLAGQFEQGGLVIGHTTPGNSVWFNDRKLSVSKDGVFAFGFHRDDPAAAVVRVRTPGGEELRRELSVTQREYDVQRIDGLPEGMVTPPKKVLDRINAEANRVVAARRHDTARTDFAEGFVWPVVGPLASVYGSQRILNGVPKQPHYGLDIAVPTGTPIVASAGGIVRLADKNLYYTGGTVIIDHGEGVSSTYLHMSQVDVKTGQTVAQGERIGAVGATGRVTGPHLCFRYNWFDSRLDPALLLPPKP